MIIIYKELIFSLQVLCILHKLIFFLHQMQTPKMKYTYLCFMEEKLINGFWWFLSPKQWWLRHALFWMYRFNNYIFYFLGLGKLDFSKGSTTLIGELIMYIVFVYFHILFLIPKVLFRKKISLYILLSAISILWLCYIEYKLFFTEFSYMNFHDPFVIAIETYLQVTGLLTMVEFLYSQKRIQELRMENLNTELSYLKSQINPHFLFNTLNNIAVLSEKYPEKVTPIIIDLSNVLKYQLYESEKELVSLENEIENIRQNLQLEVLRLNDVKHNLSVEGSINKITVAPLLFLPFLENAVKHSADPSSKVLINIVFRINDNNLIFSIENSIPLIKTRQLAGGIGLKNVRRRLDILYPDKYNLLINETPSLFKVVLKLNLS
jgi:two-component system, LytTR family, sensor kinase